MLFDSLNFVDFESLEENKIQKEMEYEECSFTWDMTTVMTFLLAIRPLLWSKLCKYLHKGYISSPLNHPSEIFLESSMSEFAWVF